MAGWPQSWGSRSYSCKELISAQPVSLEEDPEPQVRHSPSWHFNLIRHWAENPANSHPDSWPTETARYKAVWFLNAYVCGNLFHSTEHECKQRGSQRSLWAGQSQRDCSNGAAESQRLCFPWISFIMQWSRRWHFNTRILFYYFPLWFPNLKHVSLASCICLL